MMRRRSSSRWPRNPMVGISSLAELFTDDEAVASGIRRCFRRRRRLGRRRNGLGGGRGGLGLFRCRRIENAAGERIQRLMDRGQNLRLDVESVNFRLDLRTKLAGSALELVHEAADLAS